jgi:hypothetical protein
VFGRNRASGQAPGKRQRAAAVEGRRLAGGVWSGLVRRGWQAHSVRKEGCDPSSSPEPAVVCSEGGRVAKRREYRVLGSQGVLGEGPRDLRMRRRSAESVAPGWCAVSR